MKCSRAIIIFCLALLALMLSVACAEENDVLQSAFVMPASLRRIDDSAFEGTAAIEVILGESVETIGDGVFANMPRLKAVFIPKATKTIADNAFGGNHDVIVFGIAGSYAEEWAETNGFVFIHWDIWAIATWQNGQIRRTEHVLFYDALDEQTLVSALRRELTAITQLNSPKEKAEMYPIDYDFP